MRYLLLFAFFMTSCAGFWGNNRAELKACMERMPLVLIWQQPENASQCEYLEAYEAIGNKDEIFFTLKQRACKIRASYVVLERFIEAYDNPNKTYVAARSVRCSNSF